MSDLIYQRASLGPGSLALVHGDQELSYGALASLVEAASRGIVSRGLARGDRVAVYLEKRIETLVALFGTAAAGCVFVPINPQLKAGQVSHILRDCSVRALVTSRSRIELLKDILPDCHDLEFSVVLEDPTDPLQKERRDIDRVGRTSPVSWDELLGSGKGSQARPHPAIMTDMAAILYTSGSTGLPKGVVLSHQNLIVGAQSVASYLENRPEDRILSVLPLSFDAGLSQATTAFCASATLVLMNYLLPQDVIRVCAKQRITGITAVPPLWIRLSELEWPEAATGQIRYFANTGGHMPRATLAGLRRQLPKAKPFLMYGLTEAFRSTFLDPAQVGERPDSIGKAIPNAEILVLRPDGTSCDPDEPGELVHRGPLVAMGYWNDPERTAQRFRPLPPRSDGLTQDELAVWSGDRVRRDADGFLYFIGRNDDMIKTSGYRVSPSEIEEVAYGSGLVGEAVALGVPDNVLGQAIVLLVVPRGADSVNVERLLMAYRAQMPAFMIPKKIIERSSLPKSPNGKFDRKSMSLELNGLEKTSGP